MAKPSPLATAVITAKALKFSHLPAKTGYLTPIPPDLAWNFNLQQQG